ncbi:MAG: phenylalanine--tRNA ligase subunit beta [Candidatus Magasanikbacteria bacterium]|nr:phenylalanine--tRNA ligase subunit beta [Candidatus Magasanikbacteria bacterium]
MLISKKWLQDFVQIPDKFSSEELKDLLSTRVVELDGVQEQGLFLKDVVLGKIKDIMGHPNADKLKICKVFDGKDTQQVVCGGSNIQKGMLVAFARIGAKVKWHGEGDLVELKKVSIRGEESNGMICASDEIGLLELFPKHEEKDILDLSHLSASLGTGLAEALELDDLIFTIDNKSLSSRPDLWGHYGVAREIAALLGLTLNKLKTPDIQEDRVYKLSAKIKDKNVCSRYTGVVVGGISIGPSPEWMQKRLRSIGQRPINNIVDITNYVMFELAQPTHAFDIEKLAMNNKHIQMMVRQAQKGETCRTLDGVERQLTEDMFVISDGEKPVALGGIMGCQNTQVSEKTSAVLFESANFDAVTVRKTSQKLGFRTEGSARWEKSQDPANAESGLRRLVELTLQICPGSRVLSSVTDSGSVALPQGPLDLSMEFLQKKIGVEIDKKQVMDILTRLGFLIKEKKDHLLVNIPSWRATKDISIPEDLVEEVARVYGYENIPTSMPRFAITPGLGNPLRELEHKIKELLAFEQGYTEVYNYSFESPEWLDSLGEDRSLHLELKNPVAKDRPLIRRHLLPNLLQSVEANLHRYDEVKMFEIGRVFHKEKQGEETGLGDRSCLPKQETFLGVLYAKKGNEEPYHELLRALDGLFERLGVKASVERVRPELAFIHPGRGGEIKQGDTVFGHIGELHPLVQNAVGMLARVAMAEIHLDKLVSSLGDSSRYEPLPLYPEVERDIAFLVGREVQHADIIKAINSADPLIREIILFDIYQGQEIEKGKKSMAYRLVYRSDEKTLETKDVDMAQTKVFQLLQEKFKAEPRS